MRKIIILLAVLIAPYTLAHADTAQGAAKNPPNAAPQQPLPVNDADKIGTGSGDDIDTANEADPANDKDPEADEGAGN